MPNWCSRETLLYWLARALVPIGMALWLALLLRPAPTPEPPTSAAPLATAWHVSRCIMDATVRSPHTGVGPQLWVVASLVTPGHCDIYVGTPQGLTVVGIPLDEQITAGEPAQILIPATITMKE